MKSVLPRHLAATLLILTAAACGKDEKKSKNDQQPTQTGNPYMGVPSGTPSGTQASQQPTLPDPVPPSSQSNQTPSADPNSYPNGYGNSNSYGNQMDPYGNAYDPNVQIPYEDQYGQAQSIGTFPTGNQPYLGQYYDQQRAYQNYTIQNPGQWDPRIQQQSQQWLNVGVFQFIQNAMQGFNVGANDPYATRVWDAVRRRDHRGAVRCYDDFMRHRQDPHGRRRY